MIGRPLAAAALAAVTAGLALLLGSSGTEAAAGAGVVFAVSLLVLGA